MLTIHFIFNYRPLVLEYGVWDQVRVDHGKEWILTLFVQEKLAHLRRNTSRAPHLQTTSKQVYINIIFQDKYKWF